MATRPNDTTTDEAPRALSVVPQSAVVEAYRIQKDKAKLFALSPLIPDHLRGRDPETAMANCLIAIQMAEAMGEMPLVVMQNIHIVKGKAGFAAQYMIARANASGVFRGRIGWRVTGKADDMAVTAYATLADTGEEVCFTVDMAMARAEGWTSNSKYKTMPEVMLRYRSATFLVRFYAPDVMLGYQTHEEVVDVIAAAGADVKPGLTAAMIEHQASGAVDEARNDGTLADDNAAAAEGRSDEETGEAHHAIEDSPAALKAAKREIDEAELVADVNSRVGRLSRSLSEADAEALRAHAVDRIAVLTSN